MEYTNLERKGVALLLTLILVLVLMPQLYSFFVQTPTGVAAQYQTQIADFQAHLQAIEPQKKYTKSYNNDYSADAKYNKITPNEGHTVGQLASQKDTTKPTNKATSEPFKFNPNTATQEDFIALGLSPKTAQGILNYRSKGGQFRIKSDFQKIYTLNEADYLRLLPFIDLPEDKASLKPAYKAAEIDINTATAADFEKLRGIGASYANRIIKYRDKLGGFVRVEQVAEVYGFPDSTYQAIRPQLLCAASSIRKININTATIEQLKHPYLSPSQGYAILKYREQQGGKFSSVDYLQTIPALNDGNNTFQKIKPYLTITD